MNATDRAAEKLQQILMQKWADIGLGFRITAKAGKQQQTNFNIKVDYANKSDNVIIKNGMKIIIDQESICLLQDSRLDYTEDPVSGFILVKENGVKREHVKAKQTLGKK